MQINHCNTNFLFSSLAPLITKTNYCAPLSRPGIAKLAPSFIIIERSGISGGVVVVVVKSEREIRFYVSDSVFISFRYFKYRDEWSWEIEWLPGGRGLVFKLPKLFISVLESSLLKKYRELFVYVSEIKEDPFWEKLYLCLLRKCK